MSSEQFRKIFLHPEKKQKFRNVKVSHQSETGEVIKFDSRKEFTRFNVLEILQRNGMISNLKKQVKFEIKVNGEKICSYIADFTYFDHHKGQQITEDVKSEMTRKNPVYRLKKKLMKAVHKIDIFES